VVFRLGERSNLSCLTFADFSCWDITQIFCDPSTQIVHLSSVCSFFIHNVPILLNWKFKCEVKSAKKGLFFLKKAESGTGPFAKAECGTRSKNDQTGGTAQTYLSFNIGTVHISFICQPPDIQLGRINTYKVYRYHSSSVADPGCLSRIPIFTHPGSRIPDLGSRIQK
jgi:hypothetical protein